MCECVSECVEPVIEQFLFAISAVGGLVENAGLKSWWSIPYQMSVSFSLYSYSGAV